MTVYDDVTRNEWRAWGWAKEIKYDNAAPVHGGTASISVKPAAWEAIFLHHDAFDGSAFRVIDFWIHGGNVGGQKLKLQANVNGQPSGTAFELEPLKANEWKHITISLADLGAANETQMTGFWIQNRTGDAAPVFYLDDIAFATKE